MIRKFKLINANGAEFNLMRRDAFLYQPDGLGIDQSNEYMRIGNTYELIQRLSSQKEVSFTMVFKSYAIYREFADFIIYQPLKLAYMPMNEWVYIDGDITNMGKSEIDYRKNRLICETTFTATSLWYIPRRAQRTADDVPDAKKYTYSYNYTYADAINGYINVVNKSNEDAQGVITIFGEISNPSWYVSVNNNVIESGNVNAVIPAGHKLVVNSKDGHLEVAEYVADTDEFVRNLYQSTDFTRETFVHFPAGNSVLFVSGTTDDPIVAYVQIDEAHDTV